MKTLIAFLTLGTLAIAGEKQLFNGKDLTGWKGVPEFWSVKDGAITGQTTNDVMVAENTFLVWQDGEVGDFELTLKYKIVDAKGEANGFGRGAAQAGVSGRSPTAEEAAPAQSARSRNARLEATAMVPFYLPTGIPGLRGFPGV